MSIYYNAKIHDSINLPNIYYDGNINFVDDGGFTYSESEYKIYIDTDTLLYTATPYISFFYEGITTEDSYSLLKFKHDAEIEDIEGLIGENYTQDIININRYIGTGKYETIIKVIALSGNTIDDIEFKIYPIIDTGDLFIYDVEIYNFDSALISYVIYLSTIEDVEIDGEIALPYLIAPKQITSSIQPSESKASASSLNIDVINKNYEISEIIYKRINNDEVMFWNEKVEIWQNINGEEKRIFFGSIRDLNNNVYEGDYRIECSDIFDRLKIKIFAREFAIYKYLEDTETASDINTYRLPLNFSYREDYGEDGNHLVIEFTGSAMDFVEQILQMIFSNPVLEIGVPWLTQDWKEFVDLESFEEIKNILTGSLYNNFYFAFVEPIDDPFDYIREQIFKPCRIFPYINDEGKLGLKIHQQPTQDEGIITFNEDNIIRVIDKKNSIDDFVNHIMIKYDKNWFENVEASTGIQQDEFNTVFYSMEPNSVQKTRALIPKRDPLTFEVEGINNLSISDQNLFAQNIIDSYFSRYSSSITEITFQTNIYHTSDVNVGDYIAFTNNTLVDWKGTGQGGPGIGETRDITPYEDYARFNISDVWGGFIYNNNLGLSITGDTILDTSNEEIKYELFTGPEYSCETNHKNVNDWLYLQGVI